MTTVGGLEMGKCKLGNCHVNKEHEGCCAECDKSKDCEFACWLSPGTREIDYKECADYIKVN